MATPSTTSSVALDRAAALQHSRPTARWILSLSAGLLLLAVSWRFAEVRLDLLFRLSTWHAVGSFLAGMSRPDLSVAFLRTVWHALILTIATAVAGTLLAVVFALALGVLATATLWSRGVLATDEVPEFVFRLRWVSHRLARALLGFLRAVPDLVWALLFVAALGLGSLAGTLALAVAYTGVLGRVYADVFEHVDPRPLEALHSTGATRLQIFLRGVWPQALPHLVAYSVYSFECCMRAAAVLGFVGAGGIGYEISISMRLFEYGQVLTLLLVFVVLLTVTDAISRYLRSRSVKNADHVTRITPRKGPAGMFIHESRKIGSRLLVAFLVITCFFLAGFTPRTLSSTGIAARLSGFVIRMLPPDVSWSFIASLGRALLQTIAISMIGTVIGVGLAIVLAVPATSTLTLGRADAPGNHRGAGRIFRGILFWNTRLVLNVLRSIPELVWVPICILAVGIGPFAGAIALGLHTAGVLGKLYAETMDEVPMRPVEALRSLGARPLQLLLWAIWPQARPLLTSYTVLRWEMNLRASTILGLVGGGGLGQAIYNNVQLGFYPRLSTLVVLIYALVLTSDWIGERLRLSVT